MNSKKRIKVFLIILMLFQNITCLPQYWPKIYGDNISAYGEDILESYDDGFFICGSIMKDASHFKYGWLIKTDINGNILWDKKFGDFHYENYFLDFDHTRDSGLIISGATAQQDVEIDPLFIKLDPCGEIEWCKIFLSPGFNSAKGIIALPNGEFMGMLKYYDGNYQNIRISLVKLDSNGEPIWIKHLANEDSTIHNEEGSYINLTIDDNYLVSGYCFNPSLKPFFIKADTLGEQIWDIRWPVGHEGFAGRSVITENGQIYNASGLTFPGLPRIPYLLIFNEAGEILNQYSLMGDTIVRGGAQSILTVGDTTLYIGLTWSYDPIYYEGYSEIFKTELNGNLLIHRQLLGDNRPPQSIIESNDSKILVMGYYYMDGNWDIYLWKMNSELEDDSVYTQPIIYDSLCPYQITSDTVDLDCSLFVNIEDIPLKETYESTVKVSPNPARDWIILSLPSINYKGYIEIKVYNSIGIVVKSTKITTQTLDFSIDISSLSEGPYVVVCKDQTNRTLTGKFIKITI